jgi:hypothetical protein
VPVEEIDAPSKYEYPDPPVPFSLPYRGERLRWAIGVIGWSVNQSADRLHMDRGSLRQMLRERRFIPDVLGIWVETLAQLHLSFQKPMGWKEKPGEQPAYDSADQNEPA